MQDTITRTRTFSRWRCAHQGPHNLTDEQPDGTVIETCPRCGACWVIGPSGVRVRALWAP